MKSTEIILVTGPARSGKSEWAETLASQKNKNVIYVATAKVDSEDAEWAARIEKHRRRRPSEWQTLTVVEELPSTIENTSKLNCLLVDSLGTWTANLLILNDLDWETTSQRLLENLISTDLDVILVAEETGWGVVPAYESGRKFRDRLGNLIRKIGSIADKVYLVTGGHVLDLSVLGRPLSSQ
ncbi:MAG: bifunctional adenosylcobinamide kinase/adenosylcobinamide-phosphate guanylyltransferase [Prochloraceae cyanobacterium]|nr:bifunctional adenosylcobinamide kinase/adenosylcobinamide-phosphate guanylyltransferase [Prochloraceae cyanobacterium]